jgi:glyoxylate utilization-related uncharacterized protein
MSETHDVKSWPDFFAPVLNGEKVFELRKNDRNYQPGDYIHLREFDDRAGKYTGRSLTKKITYVFTSTGPGAITPYHGLSQGYAILSLASDDRAAA